MIIVVQVGNESPRSHLALVSSYCRGEDLERGVEIFSPSSAEMPGIVPVLLSRLLESDHPARSELQRHDGGANQEDGRKDYIES